MGEAEVVRDDDEHAAAAALGRFLPLHSLLLRNYHAVGVLQLKEENAGDLLKTLCDQSLQQSNHHQRQRCLQALIG
jgi:hypothetical protein